MSAASLITRLVAAGAPADLIADIAIELGRAEAEREILAQRRQKDRERKRPIHGTPRKSAEAEEWSETKTLVPNEYISNPPASPPEITSPPVKRAARPAAFPCPAGVDEAHWQDFMANRKRKRLPSTATAYAGVLRDIAKFSDDDWPPGRIIQHAAEKGWGGIYDPRESEQRNGFHRPTGREPKPDPIAAAWRSAVAEERAERDQADHPGAWPALPSVLPGPA